MKPARAFLLVALAIALFDACPVDAVAETTPSASALLARVTQPREDMALLGRTRGRSGRQDRPSVLELKFTNRDGYQLTVVAFEQTVALSVSSGRQDLSGGDAVRRFSTTTYLAHGKATPTSIQASFGDRGRIALRFRPNGREIRASRDAGCRRPGHGVIAQLGLFVGELRFRGEGAYTSAEIHRVHGGSVDLAALLACRPVAALPRVDRSIAPAPPQAGPRAQVGGAFSHLRGAGSFGSGVPTHPSRRPKRTTLLASLKAPLSRTVFSARLRGKGSARFMAAEAASEGQIGVVRLAGVSAPQAAFTFDDSLANATVAPPAPFAGKGGFRQGIGEVESWTGSLAVSFLGAPRVPLTGSPFRAQLVQSW